MYESFYKFQARPFQLSPDPRFFNGSPVHKRAMSYLRYGLTQGEGFIVITGDIGTGKTMLVRTLFADLARENVVAAQLVTTQLEADDTLRMVAASFGLAHEGLDKATILKNLETFKTARAREGKRKVLFQSFLLGQAEFRNTLQAKGLEQLRQRVIAAYHLEALDPAQTRAYIEHRLATVGWQGDPKFTDAAFSAIYQHSGGIPRRINTVCDRVMLFGSLEEVHTFDADNVNTVIAELNQETAAAPTSGGGKEETRADAKGSDENRPEDKKPAARSATAPVKPAPARSAAANGDVDARIAELEQRVAALEEGRKRERARLRRAILLSDDFGSEY